MSVRVSSRLIQLAAHVVRLSTRHFQQCSDGLLTLRQPVHVGVTSKRVYSEKPCSHQAQGQGAYLHRRGRSFASSRARQSPSVILPAQARHGGRPPQCPSKHMWKFRAGASSVLVIPELTGTSGKRRVMGCSVRAGIRSARFRLHWLRHAFPRRAGDPFPAPSREGLACRCISRP
jgi:hypothetical protein